MIGFLMVRTQTSVDLRSGLSGGQPGNRSVQFGSSLEPDVFVMELQVRCGASGLPACFAFGDQFQCHVPQFDRRRP